MNLAQKYEDPRLRYNVLTVEELKPFVDLVMTMAAMIDSHQEQIAKMQKEEEEPLCK